ncbi:MAG: hypothetical protein HFE58_12790 [Firmicutes bacterium]|nr:hypothetical protein [Bacillota bacterium]
MSIQVHIDGGGKNIILTERSILKSEYTITEGTQTKYMEESVDTVTLIGEIDLHSGGLETVNISKLAEWAFCPSIDENCYRQFSMQLFDSIGIKIQEVNFEKAFVVRYKDTFSSKRGRASYEIVIRECKGTH